MKTINHKRVFKDVTKLPKHIQKKAAMELEKLQKFMILDL